ncbi:DNA polymerase Y family protein [Vibrio sp. JPW-9-11-11]|uniref:Y-family DNA polymerase n=1 Tax=Vibrio sp. JPW-9-11-11 TaxID=1416532 RepID=UPI00159347B7|nr:DNA polymerase Y family protein [Vibrio sp. JPW-9-11-11]NVD07016.1 DNA polymerase Y family protein [Vibrio sp. JPW-9-11-11]
MHSWIYLHFATLQLDALFTEQQNLPIAIVDNQQFRIVQCNLLAQQQGIQVGMGLGSASALCHNLQVHPYDAETEQQTLLNIAQWLYMVTSDIGLFPPQGVLLKVTNMLSLYGDITTYWQKVSRHLKSLDLNYHYASGFSPLSAMLLAKSATNHITLDKEQLIKKVGRFPLSATELTSKQIDTLQRVGIDKLSDLLATPMPELARRFDIELVNYIGRLMGQFKHPIDFYHPPEQFERYRELLFDIETIQWLEKPLRTLLDQLEAFLTLRNHVAYELELILEQRDHADASLRFYSASGDYLATRWMTLCQLTMESLQLEAPVQGLTLRLIRGGELESNSPDLFNGQQEAQSELELIGLLQAKLGNDQVCKIAPNHDPRPEKATLLCEPTQSIPPPTATQRLRPTFLLAQPQPLTEQVQFQLGPERIVAGWWDGDDITRDYFIARSCEGRWLWVFRNQNQHWFVHGLFS